MPFFKVTGFLSVMDFMRLYSVLRDRSAISDLFGSAGGHSLYIGIKPDFESTNSRDALQEHLNFLLERNNLKVEESTEDAFKNARNDLTGEAAYSFLNSSNTTNA